jgi:hypothetical protein
MYLLPPFAAVLGVLLFCLAPAKAQDGYAQQPGYDPSGNAQTMDPPSQVGRLSNISGNISVEPASVNEFSAAELNAPLTTGDRLYADAGSLAEVQTRQIALRAGQLTDVTLTAVTDTLTQFGLAQGSVHLRSWGLDQGTTVELDTPNVAVTVLQPGDLRVDVDAANDTTVVTVLSGQAQVDGNGLQLVMQPGESLLLSGSNPVNAQNIRSPRHDALDRFSSDRDGQWSQVNAEVQYVNPETIGVEDLAGNGNWDSDPDYGSVWYPSGVAVDWQPYRCGHWTWVAPWGWTWVECESWGFAPFHYGRWNRFGNRWGWIPGPVTVRPIYSPALVVFVGGGAGLTGWFPLGPREVYTPWYHTSTLYLNRVNVSNIYDRNQGEVRNIYNQRNSSVYANPGNHQYVNRGVATVAMEQGNFAAGRRADQSAVRVNPQQLAGAPVLPHPLVTPQRSMVTGTPSRVMPPQMQRPVLASHEDNAVRVGATMPSRGNPVGEQAAPVTRQSTTPEGGRQGSMPIGVTHQTTSAGGGGAVQWQRPYGQQPAQQQVPQQQVPAQTPPQRPEPGNSYREPIQQQTEPQQTQPQRTQPSTPQVQPQVQQAPAQTPPQRPGPGTSFRQPIQQQTEPMTPQAQLQQAAPASQPQRPLFNRAVPPEPRPSFDQQRQAIETTDPGRPLSPQQLNNIRQNQPVGQPQQREAPHPAPAAPAPPQRTAPPPPNRH